ncbi:MAG: HEAT repeat domain-containing protein, partial [Planctomycetota bacterium]|nr:HEAT repeat domain-containing protein [Planctomycetota bacterium]
ALYFIDAFFFKEVLFPIYKTLTYQWLWRSSEKGVLEDDDEEEDSTGPGLLKTSARFVGFTFVILGAIPFLWAFSAENSMLGLGFAAAAVFLMFRLIFAKNAKNSSYRKGIVFLMLPIYFVSMVELIRWGLLLTLSTGEVPPDISDLYKQGLDILLKSSIFMGVPKMFGVKLSTLKLASTWKSLSFTGITVFVTKLVLNAALIVALVKSFTQALYSTRIYRRTGERGVSQSSSAAALAEVEELTLQGSPSQIEKVTEGLQSVAATLAKSKAYVKGVATAAEPDSEQQKAALRALNFIENENLDTFIAPEEGEEETDGSASEADTGAGLIERLISMVIVGVWLVLFYFFFVQAIDTATKREIVDLLDRASQESLVEKPLKRRRLYARVLDKDKNNHAALRLGAATDMDIAEQRVNLLDMDMALIEIDEGFNKAIELQKLIGIESELYREELRLLGARAYALRGRVFFFKEDPDRAKTELRKERTQETRRLLFALALDAAAKDLLSPEAKRNLSVAKEELGIDEEYAPASLILFARALLTLRSGEVKEGANKLGAFLINIDSFSKELRQNARFLRVRALLQLNQLDEAEKECLLMIKNDPEFGPIYLEYGDLLRRRGKTKEALKAYDKAASSPDPKVRDGGLLAGVVLALKLKNPDEAAKRFVQVAKQRATDELFQNDATLFIKGILEAETLIIRAARWGGDRHKAQMALARLITGIRALANNRLGVSALEFRRVFAQVDADSAEASIASALLDEIQIQREGRSYQSERFYHRLRLEDAAKMIRSEIRRILFSPKRISESLSLVLKMDDPSERSKAVKAVAEGDMLPPRMLFEKLVLALNDGHPDTRLAALEALSKNEFAEEAKGKVIKALKDGDKRVRRAAIRVMQGFSGSAAVTALTTALEDDDRFVRRDAAYALAKFKLLAKPALKTLIKLLDDEKVMVRDAAFAGVKAQGEAGNEALIGVLGETKDLYTSILAVKHLGKESPKLYDANIVKITEFLIRVLTTSKDPFNRNWAAQRLAKVPYYKKVADKKILGLVGETLRVSLKKSKDPAVGIGLASSILRASRTYGIDGSQAVDHYLNELKNRPSLHDDIFKSLQIPGIDEAAVPIIEGMIREDSLHGKAQDFLNNLLKDTKRKKEVTEEAIKQ